MAQHGTLPYTGKELLESLDDGREVLIYCWKQFAETCMAEYDLDGWKAADLVNTA